MMAMVMVRNNGDDDNGEEEEEEDNRCILIPINFLFLSPPLHPFRPPSLALTASLLTLDKRLINTCCFIRKENPCYFVTGNPKALSPLRHEALALVRHK